MALARFRHRRCSTLSAIPTIRSLSKDELSAHVEAFIDIARDVDGEYWGRTHFLEELTGKWQLSLAAWLANRPVGYAILSRKSSHRAHLHHFMMAADQRGRGLGGRMLEAAIERCIQQGCTEITLKVVASNQAGSRFYRRHGFENAGHDKDYDLMRRTLVL